MRRVCCLVLLLLWVLWTRTKTPTSDNWTGATGYADQEKCLASVKEKLDAWRQFKDAKFTKNTVTFTDNNTTMTYLCMPENQDPRRETKSERPVK